MCSKSDLLVTISIITLIQSFILRCDSEKQYLHSDNWLNANLRLAGMPHLHQYATEAQDVPAAWTER